MTPEMPSADQTGGSLENRNPEGRKRPYQVLRVLAKIYTIAAPLLAAAMLYNAGRAWFVEEEMMAKVGVSLWFIVQAAMVFLVMKGMAQMIYLVFDIARGVAQLCERKEG